MNTVKSFLLGASLLAASASYGQSTINFDLQFQVDYDSAGDLNFQYPTPLDGDYYGIGFLDYQFYTTGPIDLHADYFWCLEFEYDLNYDVDYSGNDYVGNVNDYFGPINLNDVFTGGTPFSIADATGFLFGLSPEDFIATVAGIYYSLPNPGTLTDVYNGIGLDGIFGPAPSELNSVLYYELAGFPNGSIDLALTQEINGLNYASILGSASLTLTLKPALVPVPEPSTYGLIGAGALVGLIGFRRFRARKAAAKS